MGGRTQKHIKLNIFESSGAESEGEGKNCHLISPVSIACRCRLGNRPSEKNRDPFVKMFFPPHSSPLSFLVLFISIYSVFIRQLVVCVFFLCFKRSPLKHSFKCFTKKPLSNRLY